MHKRTLRRRLLAISKSAQSVCVTNDYKNHRSKTRLHTKGQCHQSSCQTQQSTQCMNTHKLPHKGIKQRLRRSPLRGLVLSGGAQVTASQLRTAVAGNDSFKAMAAAPATTPPMPPPPAPPSSSGRVEPRQDLETEVKRFSISGAQRVKARPQKL